MLETVITLGVVTGVLHIANKIKQSRLAKKELKTALNETQTRFTDFKSREVVQVQLFLREDETELLAAAMEATLPQESLLTKAEATAILLQREKEKGNKNSAKET